MHMLVAIGYVFLLEVVYVVCERYIPLCFY